MSGAGVRSSDPVDLLIAGGGPAGLVAALYAARAGLRAVVVDPRTGPIDKACGEGLMPGAVEALAELGVDPAGASISGIRYLDNRGYRAEAVFQARPGRGVRRTVLHTALTEAVGAAGVEMLTDRVSDVRQSATGVRVDVGSGSLNARYLIAADGLHSPIRAQLGLRRPVSGARRWGLRAHFQCPPWTSFVEVHWGSDSEAYVTPVDNGQVGVAVLSGRQNDFATALRAFPDLHVRLAGSQPVGVRGAGPLRQRARSPVAGRVLLVGDAAGYVDALTGEGLAIAFAGARAAVDAVAADDPGRYARDSRRVSRRPRLITEATLWASAHQTARQAIVPTAAHLPWIFSCAVNQLAR